MQQLAPLEVGRKRRALLRAYSSESWRERVLHMTVEEVIAVYTRLKTQNKL